MLVTFNIDLYLEASTWTAEVPCLGVTVTGASPAAALTALYADATITAITGAGITVEFAAGFPA